MTNREVRGEFILSWDDYELFWYICNALANERITYEVVNGEKYEIHEVFVKRAKALEPLLHKGLKDMEPGWTSFRDRS